MEGICINHSALTQQEMIIKWYHICHLYDICQAVPSIDDKDKLIEFLTNKLMERKWSASGDATPQMKMLIFTAFTNSLVLHKETMHTWSAGDATSFPLHKFDRNDSMEKNCANSFFLIHLVGQFGGGGEYPLWVSVAFGTECWRTINRKETANGKSEYERTRYGQFHKTDNTIRENDEFIETKSTAPVSLLFFWDRSRNSTRPVCNGNVHWIHFLNYWTLDTPKLNTFFIFSYESLQ